MKIIVTTSGKDLAAKQTNRIIWGFLGLGALGFITLPIGIGVIFIIVAPVYFVVMVALKYKSQKNPQGQDCPHCST